MKKILLASILLSGCFAALAQRESFDIATFEAPPGWQRSDTNGVRIYQDGGQAKFCQIFISPSRPTTKSPVDNFQYEWSERVVKAAGFTAKPQIQTEATPDGWTVVSGASNLSFQGITYTCIVVTVSGHNKAITLQINMSGEEYSTSVEKFLSTFELDLKPGTAGRNAAPAGKFDFRNYTFTTPEKWRVKEAGDHIQLLQSQDDSPGCSITILTPQPSSGDLERDAKSVFDKMYSGWQFRSTGEKQYDLSKGYTQQGLEYFMMEAPMSRMSPDGSRYDGFEDGGALVIKAGDQIAIVAVRHTSMLAHNDCLNKYETWRRFFNSFTVKDIVAQKSRGQDVSKRIVGVWKLTGNGAALGEYIFAANGNYQLGGGIGSSSTTTDQRYEYLHIRSYAFQGDGSYSIEGNQLTLAKRNAKDPEKVKFRFDEVSHGATGWRDRIYLLKTDVTNGTAYEVCYEKR